MLRMLRAPGREVAERREAMERSLHDGVAIGLSALAVRLELIATSTGDALARSDIDAAREAVCGIVDNLRGIGVAIYPPLVSAGTAASLHAIADRLGLALRLDLPRRDMDPNARTRTVLLVSDYLHTLCPNTSVRVRVRGRRLVRVLITQRRVGGLPGRRGHRAVLRCG